MILIPLQPVAYQTLQVQLANQACVIDVYQGNFALYMDLYVSANPVKTGVICQNLNRIVRDVYYGFTGDFEFGDTQGTDDPLFYGLGTRWQLMYLEVADLEAAGFAA